MTPSGFMHGTTLKMVLRLSFRATGCSDVIKVSSPSTIHDAHVSPGCTRPETTITLRFASGTNGSNASASPAAPLPLPPLGEDFDLALCAERDARVQRVHATGSA